MTKTSAYLKTNLKRNRLNQSGLLSIKPKIYVCNVDEQSVQNGNDYTKKFIEKFGEENTIIGLSRYRNQINELEITEKKNYMEMIGLKQTGLNLLIQKGYQILELETYFTSGQEETRPGQFKKTVLHQKQLRNSLRFEKGFIRAETVSYDDFINNNGWVGSKLMVK